MTEIGKQFKQLKLFNDREYYDHDRFLDAKDVARERPVHENPGKDYMRGANAPGQRAILPWTSEPVYNHETREVETPFGEHTAQGTIYVPMGAEPDEVVYPGSHGTDFEMRHVDADFPLYTTQEERHTARSHSGQIGEGKSPRNEGGRERVMTNWTVEDLRKQKIDNPPVAGTNPDGYTFVWNGNHRIAAMRRRGVGATSFRNYRKV